MANAALCQGLPAFVAVGVVALLLGSGCAAAGQGSPAAQQTPWLAAAAASTEAAPVPVQPSTAVNEVAELHEVAELPAPPSTVRPAALGRLRRLKQRELSVEMMRASAEIIKKHHAAPVGTEIDVNVAGKPLVARIERHFHAVGGAIKPWGYHPGVSLLVRE